MARVIAIAAAALTLTVLSLGAPASTPPDRSRCVGDGEPSPGSKHALENRYASIGDTRPQGLGNSCSFETEAAMHGLVSTAGILLLGEVHDNAVHHHARAKLLARSLHPKPTTLIFEHIRADQAAALVPFNAGDLTRRTRDSAADLFQALDWDNSGWPDKALFEPLFAAALTSGARIAHGDPPRGLVREVARKGLAALPPAEVARLKLDQPLPPAMQEALLTELEASHCGLMPKTAFGNMALAQRYRDAYLAAQVLAAHEAGQRVILFAGNGHVRYSGMPHALSLMQPTVRPVSIQFLEVEDGKTDPRDYGKTGNLFFTPRAERQDPCEEMRARFGKKG